MSPTDRDRLQPALLDRLTDRHPNRREETADERVMSRQEIRESVRRDLDWLLSTPNRGESLDRERYPNVANSVYNYGVPPLVGSHVKVDELPAIEAAIRLFEPRIESAKIPLARFSRERNYLSFEIQGELWAQPHPEELQLETRLDLETGEVRVTGKPFTRTD